MKIRAFGASLGAKLRFVFIECMKTRAFGAWGRLVRWGSRGSISAMIEALYIHIPFCTSRCAYCDFATEACSDTERMQTYVDALCMQLRRASRAGLLGGVRTIYIGGGTPTHLGSRLLNSLVYLISLSVNLENVAEFTVECNPESLTPQMAKDLFALGVDRFSIGAQSFDDGVLAQFGRPHRSADIVAAVAAAKQREAAVSLDLICGAPGQTLESWHASLHAALDCGIDHISIYPLTVEDGTPLAARVTAGECLPPDEDVQAEMMLAAQEVLSEAGMQRYEVASYAMPGHESKHNTAYWSGVSYLGLGAAAASMMSAADFEKCREAGILGSVFEMETDEPFTCEDAARVRFQAVADSDAFASSAGLPVVHAESLNEREAVLEDAMLAFRTSNGLSAQRAKEFCQQVPALSEVLRNLEGEGLLEVACQGNIVPTERGWLMGNEVFGAIWGLASS